MTTRSTRTPSSPSAAANRSWVRGRSGVRPCRRIAIALASQGPIQMGRYRSRGGLLEDHHVAAGQHVHADALDDHLDVAAVVLRHAAIIPRVPEATAPARSAHQGWRLRHPARVTRRTGASPEPTSAPNSEPADVREERHARLPAVGTPSAATPSMSWRTNQKPSTMIAGTAMSW